MTVTTTRGTLTSPRKATAARSGSVRRRRNEYMLFMLFALPNVAIIAAFGLYPAVATGVLSFTNWDFISPNPIFVGLKNYEWIFTSPEFANVAWVTVVFTVVVVAVNVVLGLALAMLLNQKLRGTTFVRTFVFAPYVLSGAAVAMVWLFIFDPNFGLSRLVFAWIGMNAPNWTGSSNWALAAIIIVHIWKGVGFCTIVYLSALQALPTDLYEAADIDGAGGWRKFRSLTVPLLSPTTFFLLIMTTISVCQSFDIIAVMTGGGPNGATSTLSWYIYERAFKAFNVGQASASAMVLFVALLAFFVLQQYLANRKGND